jgi:hypothetical protein
VLHVVGVGHLEGELLAGREHQVLRPPDEVDRRLGQRGHGHGQDAVTGRDRRGVLGRAAVGVGGGGGVVAGVGGRGLDGGGRAGLAGGRLPAGRQGPADGADQGADEHDDDQPRERLLGGHGTSLGDASGSERELHSPLADSHQLGVHFAMYATIAPVGR